MVRVIYVCYCLYFCFIKNSYSKVGYTTTTCSTGCINSVPICIKTICNIVKEEFVKLSTGHCLYHLLIHFVLQKYYCCHLVLIYCRIFTSAFVCIIKVTNMFATFSVVNTSVPVITMPMDLLYSVPFAVTVISVMLPLALHLLLLLQVLCSPQ